MSFKIIMTTTVVTSSCFTKTATEVPAQDQEKDRSVQDQHQNRWIPEKFKRILSKNI